MKIRTLIAVLALTASGVAFTQSPAPVPVVKDPTATPGLDKREVKQQKRIDQGVASGQLSAKETNRLDKRQAKLVANETAAKSDGVVTPAERRKLQREANRNSKAIHQLKHNKQTAAPAGASSN
ncbi:MAG: hypothetical protein WCH35_16415 [Comamonadaceae bacterium]